MKSDQECRSAFTLVELLVSMAILGLLMVMLFSAFDQINRAWLQGESRVETFTQARAVLDFMAKELSQAIVTTNITFLGDTNNLAFIAPLNGTNPVDLMEVVYRPSWRAWLAPLSAADPDDVFSQDIRFTNPRWPTKLVRRTSQFRSQAIEGLNYGQYTPCTIGPWDFYTIGPIPAPNRDWPETSTRAQTAVLAENVMSLDFRYFDANGNPSQPYWNSNVDAAILHQTSWENELPIPITWGTVGGSPGVPVMTNGAPAGVRITIGIIDSKAATKLKALTPGSAPWMAITNQALRTFTTYVAIPNRQQ